jgi:hypothetical protein
MKRAPIAPAARRASASAERGPSLLTPSTSTYRRGNALRSLPQDGRAGDRAEGEGADGRAFLGVGAECRSAVSVAELQRLEARRESHASLDQTGVWHAFVSGV